MIKEKIFNLIILSFCCIVIIVYLKNNNLENFSNLPEIEGPVFVHLHDQNGNKLNIVAISKPFSSLDNYKTYLTLKSKYKFIGVSSYMEFPETPSNPHDNYKDFNLINEDEPHNGNIYYKSMYSDITEGWLHCFRNPEKFIPIDKPHLLLSESDFTNYHNYSPDPKIKKKYDYMLNCPKVKNGNPCNDWVAYNKNWELGKKVVELLSGTLGLRGLLIGRKGCKLSKEAEQNVTKTGWLDYSKAIKQYNKCRFIVMPNKVDASPRVLTEALSYNLPAIVNTNILGGWKYINDQTGIIFTDEKDLEKKIYNFIENLDKFEPRKYIIDNYGPLNSGIKLKNFLYKNFEKHINLPKNEVEYVTIRSPKINFKK